MPVIPSFLLIPFFFDLITSQYSPLTPPRLSPMANDVVFRSSLLWLALVMVVVGLCTQSLKKVIVTYMVGVVGVAGLLLPDWGYFDRDFSRWTSPVTAEERASETIAQRSGLTRFKMYPMRLAAYATIYGFGLYKWWMFVSS